MKELLLLFFYIFNFKHVFSAANGTQTNIIIPSNGKPQNSTIAGHASAFIIEARDSSGSLAGDSENFFVELYSSNQCEVGYASSTCEVLCYPYNSPHTAAKQCESSSDRPTYDSSSGLWVIADVLSIGSSLYNISYETSVEVIGYYDVSAYHLTQGGLKGIYYDNIWFVDSSTFTQIDSEINFQWGTGVITTYGTDYVSIRWEGMIKAPYNETYIFYILADDGARLWIDKQLIIDSWDRCCNETWGSVDLSSLVFHDIILEYREIRDDAYIELRWSSDSIAKTVIASDYFYYKTEINGSTFDPIYIGVGEPSYTTTLISDQTPFDDNTAGVNNSVYITAMDIFENTIETDSAVFNATNLSGSGTTITYVSGGTYKVTYNSIIASSSGFNFAITLDGNHIEDSPFTVYVSPNVAYAANTTFQGSDLTSGIAGYQGSFNVTLYDIYGNELIDNNDDNEVTLRWYGTAAGHGVCAYTHNNSGTFECVYTLTSAGSYTPDIEVNSVNAGNSTSYSTSISAGDIHGPSCTMGSVAIKMAAGTFENVTVQSRDQFSNTINSTSDNYVITISKGYISITDTINAMNDGLYNISFTANQTGDYKVLVRLNNITDVDGSPYTLKVVPGEPSATNSYVTSGTGHSSATAGTQTSFTIQTRDIMANDLENDNVTFTISQLNCDGTTITMNCTYISDGQYKCSYTPTKSGNCQLYMAISNTNISGSPFSISVSSGDMDGDTSQIIGLTSGVAGTSEIFTIIGQDSNSNNLTAGGDTLSMSLLDSDGSTIAVTGTVTDNSDGTYDISYVTTVANVYDKIRVELTQSGGLLANYFEDYSQTNVHSNAQNIIDTEIDFDWGTSVPVSGFPSADYFSITWVGDLYPPNTETYTIYTPIYAGSGVRLTLDSTLVIDEWDPASGETDPFVRVQLSANTFYDFKLEFREKTGSAKISLEWESASIDREVISSDYLYYTKVLSGSNFTSNVSWIPDSTDAASCVASGTGISSATAGSLQSVTILAYDQYSNLQTDAGDESSSFEIYFIESDGVRYNGTVTDAGNSGSDGKYTAQYNSSNATGTGLLYIRYDNVNIDSSPFTVTVSPTTVSAIRSSATIADSRAGETQRFELSVVDLYGNPCECDTSDTTINVRFTHEDASTVVTYDSIIGDGSGNFSITFTPTKSGEYTTNITVNSVLLTNSITSTFNITDAIADASLTYIRGWYSGASGNVNANSNITKTIMVRDTYGNFLHTHTGYEFYVSLLNDNSSGNEVDRGYITEDLLNGTYKINFTTPSAGTYVLKVQLASGDINEPDGLTGNYYNNRWLYGTAIDTQIDKNLSIDWSNGLVTSTAKNYVSIQWTGFIKPLYTETYNFTIISDDGSRLYIDDTLIFDHFLDGSGAYDGNHTFVQPSGLLYPIQIDYREDTSTASIQFYWESTSQTRELVPQNALFSSATDIISSPFTLTVV